VDEDDKPAEASNYTVFCCPAALYACLSLTQTLSSEGA